MVDFSEVFFYSHQPTNCPKCGVRSEIVLDLSHTKDRTQIHYCPNDNCKYEFVMQYVEDFENGSLL